jgi:hypothetical protein
VRVNAAAALVLAVAAVLVCAPSTSCKNAGGGDSGETVATGGSAGRDGVPTAAELEAYVTGAGRVRLGMTEGEVTAALGKKPSRRQDPMSRDAPTDVAWDGLPGPAPGAALGRFVEGGLVRIEYAPADAPLPRVDRAAAHSLTQSAALVQRAVARELRLAEVEAVTAAPGTRRTWTLSRGAGGRTRVSSRWLWEVEPGGEALIVEEDDGFAGQPIIRRLR